MGVHLSPIKSIVLPEELYELCVCMLCIYVYIVVCTVVLLNIFVDLFFKTLINKMFKITNILKQLKY